MIKKFIRSENKNLNVRNNKTSKILFSIQVRVGRGPGGLVEYQNTRNKPSSIPKIKLKLVLNTKIKKTTVYFIPKISCEWILYTQIYA